MKKAILMNLRFLLFRCFIFSFFLLIFSGCKKDFADKLTVPPVPAPPVPKTDKPNIILIFTDDFGYELPHYTGGESYSTPNLDFMAANGMQFTEMMGYPDGWPCRMAMFTGKYNFRNYVRWGLLPTSSKTTGNLLEDAGYNTCYVGKWQGDGGDTSIHNHGFQNYSVFLPYAGNQRERRYKNPLIYQDGAYLSDAYVADKYSEDIYEAYLENFIDSNKNHPFFAIYAPVLVAQPWVPTPDDPEFADWNYKKDTKRDDIRFFSSMVTYIDKKVGQLIQKVVQLGLQENTVIMFCGESGSDSRVISKFNGEDIMGAKTETYKWGTNQPFVVYWPGTVTPGSVDTALHSYTDFMPTFASIANTTVPGSYGTIDGMSFYENLRQQTPPKKHDWIYCDWNNQPFDDVQNPGDTTQAVKPAEIFVYNHDYKLFDTSGAKANNFYNMDNDFFEQHPLSQASLSPSEAALKAQFKYILDSLKH